MKKSPVSTAFSTGSHAITNAAAKYTPHSPILRLCAWLLPCLLALLSSAAAYASDPVGIYGIVDKVVLEPNEPSPERIKVFGTFSLAASGGYRDRYTAPQQGYLYYKLNQEKKAICQNEWADLKAMAGTGKAVAFGNRQLPTGEVHTAQARETEPVEYPIGFGLTKVRQTDYPPVKKLYEAAASAGEPKPKSASKSAVSDKAR